MLTITRDISISADEVEFSAVRSQGAGGQNVNKVSSAVHLRFDIRASSLPEPIKERLMRASDRRITKDGIVIIKAQEFRSQEKNRVAALDRLGELIRSAVRIPRSRRPTMPGAAARARRLDRKTHRGRIKTLRGKVVVE